MLLKDTSNNNNIISNNLNSKVDQTPKTMHIMFITIVGQLMADISSRRCLARVLQPILMLEWAIKASGEILFM